MPDFNQGVNAERNKMAKASLAERTENTNYIKRHLRGQMREFEILLRNVASRPSPDSVHNLRVVNRKIRTILWLVKRDPRLPRSRNLSRRLRELGGLLGKIRELDVTQQILPHFHTSDPELQRHRKQHALEIQSYLTPKLRRHLQAELNRVARFLDTIPVLNAKRSFGKLAKFARSWERGPGKSKRALHKFRIGIKRMRYSLEAVHCPDKRLRRLQNLVGQVHDLDVLPDRLVNKEIRSERKRVMKKISARAVSSLRPAIRRLRHFQEIAP